VFALAVVLALTTSVGGGSSKEVSQANASAKKAPKAQVAKAPVKSSSRGPNRSNRPNILLFITDDQRLDTMDGMPKTQRIFSNGIKYTNAYVTTPVCCPSRASIYSGQYAHNHGIVQNAGSGFGNPNNFFPRYLKQSGYRTAVFGKYLNGWEKTFGNTTSPPFIDNVFLGFDENGNTHPRKDPGDDFLAQKAISWIKDQERRNSAQPWMAIVAIHSPHWPLVAAPRFRNAVVPPRPALPSVNAVAYNKVPALNNIRGFSEWGPVRPNWVRSMTYKMLQSADVLVEKTSQAVPLNERNNTLSIFTSDNGFLWGDWGVQTKFYPYQQNIRVPMYVKYPKKVSPAVRDDLVANIDIAPTILKAANITPTHTIDGQDMIDPSDPRQWLLVENLNPKQAINPPWLSYVDKYQQFIQYYEDGYAAGSSLPTFWERYDIQSDPHSLTNLLPDGSQRPGNDTAAGWISALLENTAQCQGEQCP